MRSATNSTSQEPGPPTPADLLLSVAGQDLLARLAGLAGEDAGPDRALALGTRLRREFPPELVAATLAQRELRAAAAAKFSLADRMLFTRDGLEQASSEATARHAAARFAGLATVADLCCGIGGNLIALAEADGRRRVVAVDADPASLAFARHNVARCAPGAEAGYVRADVRALPLRGVDAAFVDPARRAGQRRLPPGEYRPALAWCLDLAATIPHVAIKAAPGLDRGLVPPGWEAEFVAVGRDLKEALLWSPAFASGAGRSRATVLPSGDTLLSSATDRGAPVPPPPLAEPGAYLLDPNPAITRAGLVADLARRAGAWQIDPMIAFLSCDEPVTTPFARTLRVLHSAPWHERRFAIRLRELGVGSADIRRRGLAGDVEQIRRRLRLAGPGAATIVLTRVSDRPWGLICVPVTD